MARQARLHVDFAEPSNGATSDCRIMGAPAQQDVCEDVTSDLAKEVNPAYQFAKASTIWSV